MDNSLAGRPSGVPRPRSLQISSKLAAEENISDSDAEGESPLLGTNRTLHSRETDPNAALELNRFPREEIPAAEVRRASDSDVTGGLASTEIRNDLTISESGDIGIRAPQMSDSGPHQHPVSLTQQPDTSTMPPPEPATQPSAGRPATNVVQSEVQQPAMSRRKTDWGPFIYAYLALSFVISSVVYSWAMVVTTGPLASIVPASESHSLAILVILSTFAGILLTELCSVTFEIIGWARVQSAKGISLPSFLGISPTTGFEGLIRLLIWRSGNINHQLWVLIR